MFPGSRRRAGDAGELGALGGATRVEQVAKMVEQLAAVPAEDVGFEPGGAGGGRTAILRETMRMLEEGGESAVRLALIAERAQVAVGLISYHFGGREGLISEAWLRCFTEAPSTDLEQMAILLVQAGSRADFEAGLSEFCRSVIRRQSRMQRVAAIGAAASRPELLAAIAARQEELLSITASLLADAQARGFIRRDREPRAIATVVLALLLGLVVHDIDPHPVPDDDILVVIQTVFGAFSPD